MVNIRTAGKLFGALLVAVLLWVVVVVVALFVVHSRVPIELPGILGKTVHGHSWEYGGYASAEGTWAIEGKSQAYPTQTSRIECDRAAKVCREAMAEIISGRLEVTLNSYEITSWSNSSIEYVNDHPTCVDYVYTISRATDSVAGIRRKKKDITLAQCSILDESLKISLVSGRKVTDELKTAAMPWFGELALLPLKIIANK